jgi:hypothetical protein
MSVICHGFNSQLPVLGYMYIARTQQAGPLLARLCRQQHPPGKAAIWG